VEPVDFLRRLGVFAGGSALLWLANIPLVVLAFKIHHGYKPVPMSWGEYLGRSALAALGLVCLIVAVVGLNSFLVSVAELPQNVLLLLLLAYVPASLGVLFWAFALDDLLETLDLFLVYHFLPGLVLYALAWFLRGQGWLP
jgi:hypothetical protein